NKAVRFQNKGQEIWVSAEQVVASAESPTGYLWKHGTVVTRKRVPKGRAQIRKNRPELTDVDAIKLEAISFKMSKRRGKLINQVDVVRDYGADSLRLYEMFMGPLPATKPWSMQGVSGVRGFLDRAWRLIVEDRADETVLSSSVQD